MPPFFLPSYATTIGLSSSQGAGLVAGYNVASLVGRLGFGASSDRLGPLNVLILTLIVNAISFLAIWPVSKTVVPLVFFVVLNGAANVRLCAHLTSKHVADFRFSLLAYLQGGFFTVMPTVVGSLFGTARLGVAMAMVVWAWTLPYLLVRLMSFSRPADQMADTYLSSIRVHPSPATSSKHTVVPRLAWQRTFLSCSTLEVSRQRRFAVS